MAGQQPGPVARSDVNGRPAPQGGEDATAELPALSAYLPACPARHSRTAFKVLFTWSSGSIAVYS